MSDPDDDDEFDRWREEQRAQEFETQRQIEDYRDALNWRRRTYTAIGLVFLLIAAALALWGGWVWMNSGEWPAVTLRTLTHLSISSGTAALNSLVDWLLDLWVGSYPLVVGALVLFSGLSTPDDY